MHKTSDIARQAGVSVRTLRYYDQIGLLKPVRGPKGTRLYGHEHLVRLQQIRLLQFVGLSLEQIGRLLEEPRSLKESLHFQVRVLTERRAQIDRILRILSEVPAARIAPTGIGIAPTGSGGPNCAHGYRHCAYR